MSQRTVDFLQHCMRHLLAQLLFSTRREQYTYDEKATGSKRDEGCCSTWLHHPMTCKKRRHLSRKK